MMTAIGYLLRALQILGWLAFGLAVIFGPMFVMTWLTGDPDSAPAGMVIMFMLIGFIAFIKEQGPVKIGRRDRNQLRSRNAEDVHPIR